MIKQNSSFILIFIFFLFLCSCSTSNSTKNRTNEFKKGEYNFSFSDSAGSKLIEGTMKLDTNAENFTGSYQITQKYVDNFPGLSTMQGSLAGTYSKAENKLFINMNPKVADANIFINGKVFRNSLVGQWSYSTIIGVQAAGSFIAMAKEE